MYSKKDDSVKYVDIFVPVNYIADESYNSALNIITPYLIANALEQFGIGARISGMRIGWTEALTYLFLLL